MSETLIVQVPPNRLDIRVMNGGGQELLAIVETEDGKLDVLGDPANWTEAAGLFVQELANAAQAWAVMQRVGVNQHA